MENCPATAELETHKGGGGNKRKGTVQASGRGKEPGAGALEDVLDTAQVETERVGGEKKCTCKAQASGVGQEEMKSEKIGLHVREEKSEE